VHYRNYLSGGLQIEYHPLIHISPSIIYNLDDNSSLLQLTLNYDWKKNMLLQTSATISNGSSDSEFNGLYSGGNSLQLLLSYYF
jgi:hypothetical protein